MEGISIGREEGASNWFVGLNFKVRTWGNVSGTQLFDNCYKVDDDLTLLDEEIRLSPKLLLKW